MAFDDDNECDHLSGYGVAASVPEPPSEPEPEPPSEPDSELESPAARPASNRRRASRSKADGLSRAQVERVLDANRLLDDANVERVVRALSGRDGRAAQVLAVLDGSLTGAARLLVDAHDEPDDIKRMVLLTGMVEKDADVLRASVKAVNALDESADVKPGGNPFELAGRLAQTAPLLDVDALRGLL